MAGNVTVKVQGLDALKAGMRGLTADMANKVARAASAAAAGVVRKAARTKAPRDTGNLQKNIIVKRLPKGETQLTSEHIVTVRKGKLTAKQKGAGLQDAYYGRFVEFGTVKMPPRPYLRPALDENIQPAIDAMRQRIRARLEKIGQAGGGGAA